MEILVCPSFKPPTYLEQYDGLIVPQEHLEGFKATMLLSSTPNAMCHAFSTIVKKASLQWLMRLLKYFIFLFKELAN